MLPASYTESSLLTRDVQYLRPQPVCYHSYHTYTAAPHQIHWVNRDFLRCEMDRPLRCVTGRETPFVRFAWLKVVPAQALPAMYKIKAPS